MAPSHTERIGAAIRTPRPRATLADLTLLVWHWKRGSLGSTAEEIWLPPAGGSMSGAARLYRDTEVVFYEIMIAVEDEGGASLKLKHFHPDLKGSEEKNETITFLFVKASGNTIWLDGRTFRRLENGSLQGFVAIRHEDGTVKKESFTYQPVKAR